MIWADLNKTLQEQGILENDVLFLKRKYFYNHAKVDGTDPIQLDLLYDQVRSDILGDAHPMQVDQAVVFASYQLQVQSGDFSEETENNFYW